MKEVDYYTEDNTFVATVEFEDDATPEYISEYLEKHGPEMQYAEGLAEPGFGPVTMDLLPEPVERGAYQARQMLGAAAADVGLIDKETYQKDYNKMNRYLQYSNQNLDEEQIGDLETIHKAFTDAKNSADTLGSVSDFFKPFADNPDAMLSLLGQVIGSTAPALAVTAVGAFGGIPGLVLGSFIGSGATEYGAAFTDAFQEAGVTPDDDEAVMRVFSDPEKLAEVRENAVKRGVTVGSFDALTMGFAGKLNKLITAQMARPGLGRRVGGAGAEVGLQAVGGAGGEALSQYLTDRYDPGEVITEALAGGISSPVDVALAAKSRGTSRVKDVLDEANLTPTAINTFDQGTTKERTQILDDLQEGKVEDVQRKLGMSDEEIIAANSFLSEVTPQPEFLEENVISEDEGFRAEDIEALSTEESRVQNLNADNSTTIGESLDIDSEVVDTAKASRTIKELDTKIIETQVDSQGRKKVIEKIKASSSLVEKSPAGKVLDALNIENTVEPSIQKTPTVKKGVVVEGKADESVIDDVSAIVNKPKSQNSPEIQRLKNAHRKLNAFPETGSQSRRLILERDVEEAAKAVYSSPDLTLEQTDRVMKSLDEDDPPPVFIPKERALEPEKVGSVISGESKQERNSRLGEAVDVTVETAAVEKAVVDQSEDSSANIGPSGQPASEIAPTEKEAVNEGGMVRAENIPGSVEANALRSQVTQDDIFKVRASDKDLNIWDMFIKFPDVLAEKHPAFAPLANAIKIRDGLRNKNMAQILQPFTILADFSRAELHNSLKALVLLDQLGSIRVDADGNKTNVPYVKNGSLDVAQLEKNAEGNFIIKAPSKEIIKQNNLDMTILEDPTTGSGLLEVVKDINNRDVPGVVLTEKELEGVQGMLSGLKTALELTINATMPEFNFQSGTTVGELRTLIRDLNTVKENFEAFSEIAPTPEEAARQIVEDSGLVVDINDPESSFNEGKSIDDMIKGLRTFNEMISPLQTNPFYVPHTRPGRIGVVVKKDGKTVWMQAVDLKELRAREFEINLPTDQGVATKIPLSRAPTNVKAGLESKGIADLKSQLQAKVNAGVFGNPNEATLKVEAFDLYANSFQDRMSLSDLNAAESVFEHVFDSIMINPQDGVGRTSITDIIRDAPNESRQANEEFVQQFKNLLKQGKAQILASRNPTMPLTRKNIPGWITQENLVDNLLQALTVYGARAAGYAATQKTSSLIQKGVDNTAPLTKLHTYAKNYRNEVDSGSSDYGHMKRLAFHYFLGFNVSSALVNLTQVPMSALPYIARFSSGGSASKEILVALDDARRIAGLLKGLKRTAGGRVAELITMPFEQTGLKNTARNRTMWSHIQTDLANGRLMSQVTAEQLGQANYGNDQVFRSSLGRAENISSAIFTYAELMNRLTTYIAAHRTYTKSTKFQNKIRDALKNNYDFRAFSDLNQRVGDISDPARMFAAFTVDKTQYYMGVENRPNFMRGPVLGVITQFMQFPARYLQMITRLAFDATSREGFRGQDMKERAGALSAMAAFMIATGGFWSLPLSQQAADAYDLIYKALYGVDPVVRAQIHTALQEAGLEYPEYFTRGLLSQVANIALVNRTGAGVVLQPEMFSGDPTKAFGPAGSMLLGSGKAALTNLHRGDYFKAFANLMPTAGYNIMKSTRMLEDGYSTTNRGIMAGANLDLGLKEAIAQGIGFQPENVGRKFETDFLLSRESKRTGEKEQAYRDMLRAYAGQYLFNQRLAESAGGRKERLDARRKMEKAAQKYAKVVEDIREYNQDILNTIDLNRKNNVSGGVVSTYLLNITGRSLKNAIKNGAYDVSIQARPGPKLSRRDLLKRRYSLASEKERKQLIKEYGLSIFE